MELFKLFAAPGTVLAFSISVSVVFLLRVKLAVQVDQIEVAVRGI